MEKKPNNTSELELYIHIPFCVKKCDYCDFLSGAASENKKTSYMNALLREIDAIREDKKTKVISVFIGGGTPSVVDEGWIVQILEKLREKFIFSEDAEITIETNPGTLNEKKLKTYLAAGINRVSIGLQSVNDNELKMLGRIHDYAQFKENYFAARNAGFKNINVDLMFAIPEQTSEQWKYNLETVAKLGPEHISAYSLIIEEGTPFARRNLKLPDEDTEYKMYEDTAEILAGFGYEQYEISNYAKKGYACRHNLGYWKRKQYLGLGLGASSLIEEKRFSNTSQMEKYLEWSSFPQKIRENTETLSTEAQMEEFMFLGLRMTKGIRVKDFEKFFGCHIEDIYGKVLEKYKKNGMLLEEEGRIFLSRQGIHVSNIIMSDFLI